MPKKVRLLLIGDAELRAKLSALTDAEARKAVLGATREAAKLIQAEVKRTVPKRTGLLRKSVRVRSIKRSRKRIGVRVTTSRFNSNYQGKAFYGAFLEFGWKTKPRKDASARAANALQRKLVRRNARLGKLSAYGPERALQEVKMAEAADRQVAKRPPKERKQIAAKEYIKKATDQKKDAALALFKTKIDDHIRKVIGKRK